MPGGTYLRLDLGTFHNLPDFMIGLNKGGVVTNLLLNIRDARYRDTVPGRKPLTSSGNRQLLLVVATFDVSGSASDGTLGLETKTGTVDTATDSVDIFAFTPPVSGNYGATLTGFSGNLDLYIADINDYYFAGSYTSVNATRENLSVYLYAGQTYYLKVEATSAANNNYYLTLTNQSSIVPNSASVSDQEPNDSTASANVINVETASGTIDTTTDMFDYFAFTPPVNGLYSATLTGYTGDLDIYLQDAYATYVSFSATDMFGGSETILYYMQAGQTYYLKVDAWNAANDSYSLTVAAQ